jgi:hypothetical protein
MTQDEINKAVAKAVEARKLIQELREAGLIRDSYFPALTSGLSAVEKKLKRTNPDKDGS